MNTEEKKVIDTYLQDAINSGEISKTQIACKSCGFESYAGGKDSCPYCPEKKNDRASEVVGEKRTKALRKESKEKKGKKYFGHISGKRNNVWRTPLEQSSVNVAEAMHTYRNANKAHIAEQVNRMMFRVPKILYFKIKQEDLLCPVNRASFMDCDMKLAWNREVLRPMLNALKNRDPLSQTDVLKMLNCVLNMQMSTHAYRSLLKYRTSVIESLDLEARFLLHRLVILKEYLVKDEVQYLNRRIFESLYHNIIRKSDRVFKRSSGSLSGWQRVALLNEGA